MSELIFGRRPELLRLLLMPGYEFILELEAIAPDEFNHTPLLRFPGLDLDWPSVQISSSLVQWDRSSAEVDLVVNTSPDRDVHLIYGEMVWAMGKFEIGND